tara:strand:- start:71 stop:517 length:447 start_codon:yes stop_codon:yes gene_type:complete
MRLKRKMPKFIKSYPINKSEISKAILSNKNNLKKITKIVHPLVRLKMLSFIRKNKKSRAVILDIPLYFENKINNKGDIIVFVDAKKSQINNKLKRRPKFNIKILKKFKEIQLPIQVKKRKSNFIIKNNFKNASLLKSVNILKKTILNK